MDQLIIMGAGGHGKVVADIAQKIGKYKKIVFLDDGDALSCVGYPVIGKSTDLAKHIDKADFFVAIGNNKVRKAFIDKIIELGGVLTSLIHPSAIIGKEVSIGIGTAVMAGAVINPCTKIGRGVIVNTCSSIDHDCIIGDYSHLAVGVHVAGTVTVGNGCFLGAGVIIKNNICICNDCILGAGAVVVEDIEDNGTYVGVPAKLISEKNNA